MPTDSPPLYPAGMSLLEELNRRGREGASGAELLGMLPAEMLEELIYEIRPFPQVRSELDHPDPQIRDYLRKSYKRAAALHLVLLAERFERERQRQPDETAACGRCDGRIERYGENWRHADDSGFPCPRACPPGTEAKLPSLGE